MFFYSFVIDSQKLISTCGHVDILRFSLGFRLINKSLLKITAMDKYQFYSLPIQSTVV